MANNDPPSTVAQPHLQPQPASPVDEETPLLGHQHEPQPDNPQEAEQTVIPKELSNARLAITLGTIWVGVFLGALDSTVIATLTAPISTSFNSLSLLSWLASAYLIANAACQPLSGRLTDIFGRGPGLVVSNILFATGNLLCGLAPNEWSMIAGRVIAGMGGGGLMAISTFVGSDLVPLRKRGIIQGLGNVCYGTGAGLGGLFGGWVNDTWNWRWAFIVQVPFVVVSAILVYIMVQIPPKVSAKSKLSRVDFLGAFSLVSTLILFLLGLNAGGNIVPWNHPLVLVSLPLSFLSLLAFIYIETFVASEPIIPVRLLANRTVAAACLTNWFSTMSMFMVTFYVPIFYQVAGHSATSAGQRFIPIAIGSASGSLGSGWIMNHTGKYKLLGICVILLNVSGIGVLSTLTFASADFISYICLAMIGAGTGGMLTVTLLATISAVSHDHQAVVTSATYAFRSTGSTIGITIAGAVYQNTLLRSLHSHFDSFPGADEEINRIRDNYNELKHLPPGWKDGVMDSFSWAFKSVFLSALTLSLVSLACALFMRQHTLHTSISRRDSE